MMLTEFATPVTAKMVSATANGTMAISVSTPGMSVRRITASSNQIARLADSAVANRRRRGDIVLVRSSAKPATKAGMPAATSSHGNCG